MKLHGALRSCAWLVACGAIWMASASAEAQQWEQPAGQGAPHGHHQIIIVPDGPVPPPAYAPEQVYVVDHESHRVESLQQRMAYLRAERSRYRSTGPIVMMAIGGVMLLVGASGAGALWTAERDGYDGGLFNQRRAASIFTAVAIGGGVLGLVGTFKLLHRRRLRRPYDLEIRQIHHELRMIRRQQRQYGALLDVGLTPAGLGARLRF